MSRTTRLLLDVTWDEDVQDKPTTWNWNLGIDASPADLPIVVVGEVTGRDDELLTVLEELKDAMDARFLMAKYAAERSGLDLASRMVQDAINENTPEPPDLDGEDLFPARPVSNTDRLTALALEASSD